MVAGHTLGVEAEAWLNGLIPELLDTARLESIVSYTDDRIVHHVPELDTELLRANLHASSLALGREMLPGLPSGSVPAELPDEAHALAESLADSGLDLRALLRVYRMGQQAMIRTLTDEIGRAALGTVATSQLTGHVATCLADWAGSAVEVLSENFTPDAQGGFGGRVSRRRETVRALLAGLPVAAEVVQLRLGYSIDDTHLGFVLWFDEDTAGSLADLERTARTIAGHLDSRGICTLACGARTLWAWVRTNRRAGIDLSVIAAADSVRAAFGLPAPGAAGFRRSHLESLAAQQMHRAATRPNRVVLYDSVELHFLLSRDGDAMHAFVERELDGLLGTDGNRTRLRDTLSCYLELMCSVEATARELGVHRNTVRYRLERIEQLLGRSIESRRLELEIALRYAATDGGFPLEAGPWRP